MKFRQLTSLRLISRHISVLFAASALVLLTGCLSSLYPLFTPDEARFEEGLLGVWKEKPDSDESWTFRKSGEKAYTVEIASGGDDFSVMTGRLGKLGNSYFLDLVPDQQVLKQAKLGSFVRLGLVEAHVIIRVDSFKPNLILRTIDGENFTQSIKADPKSVQFLKLTHGDEERLVLAAPTRDLQKYILAHIDQDAFWSKPSEPMTRTKSLADAGHK